MARPGTIPPLAFAGGTLIRDSEHRTDEAVAAALARHDLRMIAFAGGRLVVDLSSAPRVLFARHEAVLSSAQTDDAVLLGHDGDGAPWLAAPLAAEPDALPVPFKAIDLRSVVAQGLVSGPALAAVAQGAALLAWHGATRFCGRCGAPNAMRAGGMKRTCTGCGRETFPRTDPVVIMLVTHGDRCLLGRSPHFPPGMHSALAGFVEPGETIEEAVRRETYEEAGIRVGPVTYLASQPWPMPHSLMIGCVAEALHDDIRFDDRELESCRWFTRDDLAAIMASTHAQGVVPPLDGAIARALMTWWLDR